jgi:hypothetical protein
VVQLGMGMVGTLSALVLGLLVASPTVIGSEDFSKFDSGKHMAFSDILVNTTNFNWLAVSEKDIAVCWRSVARAPEDST